MNKGEIVELTIEKLVYGGEGIGKIGNTTVFVEDVAPNDRIRAEIVSVKKDYAKAILKEVVEPSPYRVKPVCALAKVCGGCQRQHIDYAEQLRAKKQIVSETLERVGGIQTEVNDVLYSGETTEYRCKVQLPVSRTKVSKRFLAGYYRKNTHEVVNIKYCPVQPAIINQITAFLLEKAKECELSAYNEKTKKGLIRHFVYRYSKVNQNLTLTIAVHQEKVSGNLWKLCHLAKEKFPQLAGVAVNFNTTNSNLILTDKTELIEGNAHVTEKIGDKLFRISCDAFFQVNPSAAGIMFNEVRKIVAERTKNPEVLDIYAGSGGFSIFLSDIANKIVAVEDNKSSIADGKHNLTKNNIKNVSYREGNADVEVPKLLEQGRKFDVVVLDPPRKGCSEAVLNAIKGLASKYLIYVSCNPSTLARDIKLLGTDFKVVSVQPMDMFSHTWHIETICLLAKSGLA
ncbi:MAG: 23S rRNA (uracil(1939)-C(5))-methyltransferase RlmD [Candidatus Gastranaerophilales bacterium]|nr:23S rRNA (uracil(1939)-C(5))-methyltransferase RlmD [Candidatus Gastranaerophilales bacterium]